MEHDDGPAPAPGGPAPSAPEGGALFLERLWPSPAVWLLVPATAAAAGVVVLPVGVPAAVTAAAVAAALVLLALVRSTPTVEVADGALRAGRARIEFAWLGEPAAARGQDARHERGPGLDPRAHLLIRGWVDPVVRVPLHDPGDPTPYWLVSTRRPDDLVTALRRAGAARRPPGG
ncbi:DUF3093 domain-containing protein [Thalassiella azotivora]